MAARIKKGDRVHVLTGKDAGKTGNVIAVFPTDNRVLVQGINKVKRHEKVRPASDRRRGQEGGIIVKEMPVDLSNVALICPTDGPVRTRVKVDSNGAKVRVCVKCETELG